MGWRRVEGLPGDSSDLHDLGRLLLGQLVDLALELLGQGLNLFLAGLQVVLGEDLLALLVVGLLVGVAADVADRDAGLLGEVLDAADQLLALLDRERRGR